MTETAFLQHLARRRAKATRFATNPERYKVCAQCWSIAPLREGVCRICGTYRWDKSLERVREVAEMIGRSPFPVTAGTVPRLESV
jgi:hypothetical protein